MSNNPNQPENSKVYWKRKLAEIEDYIEIAKTNTDLIINISKLDTVLPINAVSSSPVLRLTIDLNESRLNDIKKKV